MKWGIKAESGLRRSASVGSAHYDERSEQKAPLIADDVYDIIMKVSKNILT
jgi:hypothetical protein